MDNCTPLELTGPPVAKLTRAGYRHTLADGCCYETIYGTKARAMKRWREIGMAQNPPSPPPLDDPSEMIDWWERCMSNRPSAGVLLARERFIAGEFSEWLGAASTQAAPASPATIAAASPSAKPEKSKPGRITLSVQQLADIRPLELEDHLEEMKRTTAILRAEYEEAARNRAAYDDTLYARAHKRYHDSVSSLTELEEKLAAHRQKTGALVSLDRLRAELPPLLATVSEGFLSLLINDLGIPRPRALSEVDRLFRAFRESRFAAPSAPAAAA